MTRHPDLLARIESYIMQYVTFTNPDHAFAAALWSIATYVYPLFDAFPYMIITSATKRSGKTRFSEVLSFVCSNPVNAAGVGPAPLFRMVRDMHPTVILDEAEDLNRESASPMRSFLNVGYRKGQKILKVLGGKVVDFDAYCPKVFILIGDVYDTLRDRSIIMRMKRAEAKTRFVFDLAQGQGQELREQISTLANDHQLDVQRAYESHKGLSFLQDRDEEIWLPLFAVCAIFAPDRMKDLERVATDLSVEKTERSRSYILSAEDEQNAEAEEYSQRLLTDLLTVIDGRKSIFSADAIAQLRAIVTAPWRKFRGDGLNAYTMADLLSSHGVFPVLVRQSKDVQRGYKRADVEKAIKTT
jgi:hypothetical protein